MVARILEIGTDGVSISKHRGFLHVESAEAKTSVDLDQLGAVVLTAHSAMISRAIMDECARRGIPVVFSGPAFMPSAIAVPISTSEGIAHRVCAQVTATAPKRKRIWQTIVIEKIRNQAKVLRSANCESAANRLDQMAGAVNSGDTTNREAVAAKQYWTALFGKDFRRNKESAGVNAALNYGYAILRSAFARSIAASGLSLAIGIHHENARNPMCLVDDLMEPYRPVVDAIARELRDSEELTVESKRALADVLVTDVSGTRGITTLHTAASQMVLSLVSVLCSESNHLEIPTWSPEESGDGNPIRV